MKGYIKKRRKASIILSDCLLVRIFLFIYQAGKESKKKLLFHIKINIILLFIWINTLFSIAETMKSIKINWRKGYIEEYQRNNYESNSYVTICKASSRNAFCILKQKYKTSNCLWDAIEIDVSYLKLYTIPHFTEWENLKINLYYESFKRIWYFKASSSGDKN